jgi:hypothetical protein
MAIVYNTAPIVRDGLVMYLDAGGLRSYSGTGSQWNDLSGRGNHATLIGSPTYDATGPRSINFNGISQTANCGPVSDIGSSLTGLTVSMWVYTNSASVRCIAENGSVYSSNTFYMFQEDATSFTFLVYGGAGSGYDVIFSNYAYQLNRWYNLVGVWSSGNRVSMYTNGVATNGARNGSLQTGVINGNSNLFIGSRAGTEYFFSGKIGGGLFYNRALSAAEVSQNFESSKLRYGL